MPCGWSYQVVPTYLYPFVPALSIESKKLFFSVVEPFLGYFNESLSSHNAYTNCILLPSAPFLPSSPVILNGSDQKITLPFSAKRPEHNQAILPGTSISLSDQILVELFFTRLSFCTFQVKSISLGLVGVSPSLTLQYTINVLDFIGYSDHNAGSLKSPHIFLPSSLIDDLRIDTNSNGCSKSTPLGLSHQSQTIISGSDDVFIILNLSFHCVSNSDSDKVIPASLRVFLAIVLLSGVNQFSPGKKSLIL